MEMRDFKQVFGAEIADMSGIRIRKVNKTHRGAVGTIKVQLADIDNEMLVGVRLYAKQGGEYRLLPYKLQPKKLCDFFNEDTIFFPELVKYSDVPKPFPCPVVQVRMFGSSSDVFNSKILL
jgi:hypothetical protein